MAAPVDGAARRRERDRPARGTGCVLPDAVAAEQREHVAGRDVDVDRVQDRMAAEGHVDALGPEQ